MLANTDRTMTILDPCDVSCCNNEQALSDTTHSWGVART